MLPQKKPLSKVYELLVHFNVCVLLEKDSYFPYWSWAYWTSALVLPSRFAIAVVRKHYIKVKPKRFKTCSNVFQSERVFIDSFVALQRLLRHIWARGIIDCCGYDEFIKWVELITCNRLPSGLILGILLKIFRIRSWFPCESKPSWKKKNADPRLTLNNQIKFVKRRARSFLRKRSLAWLLRGRNAWRSPRRSQYKASVSVLVTWRIDGLLESFEEEIIRVEASRIRQTANVRFKLRISQNRKWADKNNSKQFLWIKNWVKLLI